MVYAAPPSPPRSVALPPPPPPVQISITGWGEFNPIGGFADGRYKLSRVEVKPGPDGAKKLILTFTRKRGIFVYTQKEELLVKEWRDGLTLYYPPTGRSYTVQFTPIWKIERRGGEYLATPHYRPVKVIIERDRVHMELTFTPKMER